MSYSVKLPNLTIERYLALEESASVRHEYINGQVFEMSGATEAHNLICGNLYALLHGHLRGSGCRPFMNDMKVRLEVANSFYYPDVMVTCEPFDGKSVFKKLPVLVAEVLSPSTTHIDRREKLVAYRQLESLRQYLIVHQSRYRVELYQRDDDGQWEVDVHGRADSILFDCLTAHLVVPVESLYEGVIIEPLVEEDGEDYEPGNVSVTFEM